MAVFLDAPAAFHALRNARDLELSWDDGQERVVVAVRLGKVARPREELAAAISAANADLKLVGFRLDGEQVIFSLSAFLEPDGRISSAVLDRLILIARIAVRSFGGKLTPVPARPKRRVVSPEVDRRPVELSEVDRGEIAAAALRDLPAVASLAASPRSVNEISQSFFPHHRVLELELDPEIALYVAMAGEAHLLTTRLETLNRIAAAELTGADLEDEAFARSYLTHASHWARPALRERRIESLPGDDRVHPPRLQMNVAGHQLVFLLISDERLVRRTAVLHVFDAHLELHDEMFDPPGTSTPPRLS